LTPLHPRSFRRHPQERIKKWKRTFGYRGSYSLQSHSVIPEEAEVLVHAENIVQLPPEAALCVRAAQLGSPLHVALHWASEGTLSAEAINVPCEQSVFPAHA
jgi:hypothetical protein